MKTNANSNIQISLRCVFVVVRCYRVFSKEWLSLSVNFGSLHLMNLICYDQNVPIPCIMFARLCISFSLYLFTHCLSSICGLVQLVILLS